MALTLGVNCGFVTTAPTGSPGETVFVPVDDTAMAMRATSPAGNYKVTEIGWYAVYNTEDVNFEVGIYEDDAGDTEPGKALGNLSKINAKGATDGWKRATGLNIPLDSLTTYWIAMQLDDTSSNTGCRRKIEGGENTQYRSSGQTELPVPWGDSVGMGAYLIAIYALVEEIPATALTFGDTNSYGGNASIEDRIAGLKGVSPIKPGVAISMTAKLTKLDTESLNTKLGLFDVSDGSLVAETDEVAIYFASTYTWYTFSFSGSPRVDPAKSYYLLAISDTITGTFSQTLAQTITDASPIQRTSEPGLTYPSWDAPYAGTESTGSASIYCTYIPDPDPTIQGINSISGVQSITI